MVVSISGVEQGTWSIHPQHRDRASLEPRAQAAAISALDTFVIFSGCLHSQRCLGGYTAALGAGDSNPVRVPASGQSHSHGGRREAADGRASYAVRRRRHLLFRFGRIVCMVVVLWGVTKSAFQIQASRAFLLFLSQTKRTVVRDKCCLPVLFIMMP